MTQKRPRKKPEPVKTPQAPATPPFAWKPHALRVLAACALALVFYANSFRDRLIFDSVQVIQNDSRVHAWTAENLHLIFAKEYWYQTTTTNLYRPLTTLTYLVNYAVLGNGTNPAGYHGVNLAIHFLNIALVYWLGLLVFEDATLALALAALWGVHPVLTEAVTNIVGRADILAAFGVLAGLVCHAEGQRAAEGKRIAWLSGLALAAAIGMFAKESGVILPGAMLLYDLVFPARAPWSRRWQGYAAVVLPFVSFFYLRAQMKAANAAEIIPGADNPLWNADFWTARLTSLTFIGDYLRLFFWPSKLSPDYAYNQLPLAGWSSWRAWLSGGICIGAVCAALASWRRNKPLSFWLFWFFIAIAPVANFFLLIGATIAERLMYLPALGLAGCVVVALARLRQPRRILAATALLCCALGARTFVRNFDWYDEPTLWTAAVRTVPNSFRSHMMLAEALKDRYMASRHPEDLDRATEEAATTLRILDPLSDIDNATIAYIIAGSCFRLKGDAVRGDAAPPAGAEWFRKAVAALERGERVDRERLRYFQLVNLNVGKKVLPIGYPALYLELARSYLRLGQPSQALQALLAERDARSDPAFPVLAAQAYQAMGDNRGAETALIEGLVVDPNDANLAARLMAFYQQVEPASCAVKTGSIDMTCPLVHSQICTASRTVAQWYAQGSDPTKATTVAGSAVQQMGCPAEMFR